MGILLQKNIQRLREYRRKLILFPKNAKKPHKGDASEEELKMATQVKGRVVMPLKKQKFELEKSQVIDPKIQKANVYSMLIEVRIYFILIYFILYIFYFIFFILIYFIRIYSMLIEVRIFSLLASFSWTIPGIGKHFLCPTLLM